MKQAILLTAKELSAIKRGALLDIEIGGHVVSIGFDRTSRNVAQERQLKAARAAKQAKNGTRISKATGKPVRPYRKKTKKASKR